MSMKKKLLAGSILFVISSFVYEINASEVDLPNSFSPGDVVSSSKINENFSSLEDAVDDNYSYINENISAIESNTSAINSNGTSIDDLQADLQNLDSTISQNAPSVLNGNGDVLGAAVGFEDSTYVFVTQYGYLVSLRFDPDGTPGYRVEAGSGGSIYVYFTTSDCSGQGYTNLLIAKSVFSTSDGDVYFTGKNLVEIQAGSQFQGGNCTSFSSAQEKLVVEALPNDISVTGFDLDATLFPIMFSNQ